MSNDIILLADLAWTNDINKTKEICDKLYNKYYNELNSLYKENCTAYINLMTHISFTLKILSKHIESKTDMHVIKQISIHSSTLLNIINDYEEINFAKLPTWQVITVCHSIKKLVGLVGMQFDKSTCLGNILNERDFEIVKYYIETGKFKEERNNG